MSSEAPDRGPEPSRRERRKAETRQRLLDAARALFIARGFDATRPQDVARLADVGAGTFYAHFADKRAVFRTFTEQAAGELTERMVERARGAPDIETRLRRSLEALIEYSEQNPGVVRACFADEAVISPATAPAPEGASGPSGAERGASLRDLLARNLAQSLREGILAGRIRREYDPHVIAFGIVGFIHQAFLHGSSADIAPSHLIENITRFCGRALAPDRIRQGEIAR